jgi:predicted dehydrogenase
MGRAHLKAYQEHPQCEVVAVADPDAARLKERGDEFKVEKRFATGEELIDAANCDIVSVVVPNKMHKDLTIRALRAGAHVLCEKPMAMNAAEAREMRDAARQANKRIMINFSYRFTPQAQALKSRVDAGAIGEAYYARTAWLRRRGMPGFGGWFGTKELAGGGPLIDLGVHRLDLALWLMGYPQPEWVMGATYDPIAAEIAAREGKTFTVEDLATGYIRFKNGATLSIEASWAANIKEKELMETRILGTKGGLVHRNKNEGYEFEAELYEERDGYLFDSSLHSTTAWSPAAKQNRSAMYHFADAILHDEPHDADAAQGIVVMELLDSLYESARTGAPVRVA